MILMYIFETYLDLRQHAALKLPTLPKSLVGVISSEKFEKSRVYSLDKSYFHFVNEAVSIIMDTAILCFGVLPWSWKISGEYLVSIGLDPENEILHSLGFWAGGMIWSEVTDLPFSLYSTFVIEARHGFNKQTIWLFFRDMFKGICLSIILGPPIVAAIIIIVQKGGPYLAIYLWGFMFVLSIVMMTIYPILIAPLFNKFSPLPDGELREKIENLASSLKFPLKKLFVVDGSTRSSHSNCENTEEVVAVIAHELRHWKLNHTMYTFIAVQEHAINIYDGVLPKHPSQVFSHEIVGIKGITASWFYEPNSKGLHDKFVGLLPPSHSFWLQPFHIYYINKAYMYGFFKNNRIALYDTLIQQCENTEEVVAIISHELGHWKLNHTMYTFIAVQVLTFLQIGGFTLARNSKDLFRSFGFDTQPVLIGLIIFERTVNLLQHLLSFGLNLVIRSFEFQADAFAKKLGYVKALRAGLVKLQEENLSSMNTDPWYSAYHYTCPPAVERLAVLDEPDKKVE
ncbi:CAAX prenyl protease 1 homolog isoform X2 [Macadamia integrifolia]|uniref:CAAX prenyl protease 1 homolog isoform X2 n=1 Tax=Macadamia integrifolia TaxID=60698 RepID=UPI001C4F76B2|nr:CAAX prenyl protease 1 homolog isoform X2 [Macadamia integrifolia]